MRTFFLLSLLLLCTVDSFAQKNRNTALGFSSGIANYYGEFNQSGIINTPKFSGSFFVKNPIGTRYAIRTGFMFGSVAFDDQTYFDSETYTASGGVSLKELSSLVEFSFYDVEYKNRTISGSPYLMAGIGISVPASGGAFFGDKAFVLPFGAGYKLQVSGRLEFGAEFLLRKTSSDILDNTSISSVSSFLHNNDYYSTVSLLISYKFFKFAGDCPVYIKKNN